MVDWPDSDLATGSETLGQLKKSKTSMLSSSLRDVTCVDVGSMPVCRVDAANVARPWALL